MSWRTNRRTGQHFQTRPRKGSNNVRMSQKGSSMEGMDRIEGAKSKYITYDFSAELPNEETRKRIGYADSVAGPFKCSDCRYGQGGGRACSKFHILVEPNACCSSYEKK